MLTGENGNTAYCHLYVAGDTKFENGLELNCVTEYPYAFTIRYEIRKGRKRAGSPCSGLEQQRDGTRGDRRRFYGGGI